MYNTSIYISKSMGLNIKQFVNGNIVWLFGKRGSIKTKIVTTTVLKEKYNYLVFEELLIMHFYKKLNVIHSQEKKMWKRIKNMNKKFFNETHDEFNSWI